MRRGVIDECCFVCLLHDVVRQKRRGQPEPARTRRYISYFYVPVHPLDNTVVPLPVPGEVSNYR